MPGYIYDSNHLFGKDDFPENLYRLTYESIGGTTYDQKFRNTRGYERFDYASGWKENPSIGRDSTWMKNNHTLYDEAFKLLKDIVEDCKRNDVYVVGIIFPQSPAYQKTGLFGIYGPQRSVAIAVINDFSKLSECFPNFIVVDENKMGNHDYSENMAKDVDHLSHLGAVQITHRLDSLLCFLKK